MTYRVIVQPPAEGEIEQVYLRIAQRAPQAAASWFNGLLEAIRSLADFPQRCALAPENDAFEEEIRQLLYGRKGRRYRALFTTVGDEVHVLHFRHWAQRPMKPEEIRGS